MKEPFALRLIVVALFIPALLAAAPILDRNLDHYTILGIRQVRLKNFTMEPPGCHVGVDCAHPASQASCGVMRSKQAKFADGSQAVADQFCGTESFYEVFRNNGFCTPDCSMISSPGPKSDCASGFVPPLIGDADGDGQASCASDCSVDLGDVAARCGVTLPFPSCNPTRGILVVPNGDCSTNDLVPGNFQCDLEAGTYGLIQVRNGARIEFQDGTTVACGVKAGKATRIRSVGTTKVLIPGKGRVRIGNSSDAGTYCDALTFVTERGSIHLGKQGDFAIDACAIASTLHLGHGNNLKGRFLGLNVVMDLNNDGRCCEAPPPTTTTTTQPGGTTTTTTEPGQTTTTTEPGGTTTTTTTEPGQTTTTATQPGETTTTTSTTTTQSGGTTTTATQPGQTTTTTTLPGGGFTRTIGFYKTHPAITQQILAAHGPFTICGKTISDTDVDHGHSALEAMCGTPGGNQRLQLVRQLTAAALSTAAGGAQFDATVCNAVCIDPQATVSALSACINDADAFNNSGDGIRAPWDPAGAANPTPCEFAGDTPCTVLSPNLCTTP